MTLRMRIYIYFVLKNTYLSDCKWAWGICFEVMKMFWNWVVVMVAQCCKFTKNHWIVHNLLLTHWFLSLESFLFCYLVTHLLSEGAREGREVVLYTADIGLEAECYTSRETDTQTICSACRPGSILGLGQLVDVPERARGLTQSWRGPGTLEAPWSNVLVGICSSTWAQLRSCRVLGANLGSTKAAWCTSDL